MHRRLAGLGLLALCGLVWPTAVFARPAPARGAYSVRDVDIPGLGSGPVSIAPAPARDGGVADAFLVAVSVDAGVIYRVAMVADGGFEATLAPELSAHANGGSGDITLRADCDLDGDGVLDTVVASPSDTSGASNLTFVSGATGAARQVVSMGVGVGRRLACVSAATPWPGVLFASTDGTYGEVAVYAFTQGGELTSSVATQPGCGASLSAWTDSSGRPVGIVGCAGENGARVVVVESVSASGLTTSGSGLPLVGAQSATDVVGAFTGGPGPTLAVAEAGGATRFYEEADGGLGNVGLNPGGSVATQPDGIRRLGDVNGDGFPDVAVARTTMGFKVLFGARPPSGGESGGRPAIPAVDALPGTFAQGCSASAVQALGRIGDVNHDGFADFAVACGPPTKLYVYTGAPGPMMAPSVANPQSISNGLFNDAVDLVAAVGVGDVDGDGRGDVLIVVSEGGTLLAYLESFQTGSARPVPLDQAVTRVEARTVAAAGDLNGDGLSDFVIGTPEGGAVFVYYGRTGSNAPTPTRLEWPDAGTGFGLVVAGIGDVDGDGYGDLAVADESGDVHVFRGGAAGLSESPAQVWRVGTVTEPGSLRIAGAGFWSGDRQRRVVVAWDTKYAFFGMGKTESLAQGDAGVAVAELHGPVDADGDGRPEVLLVTTTPGVIRLRPGSEGGVVASPESGIGNVESVVPLGDFDGDSRDDFFARAGTTKHLWRALETSSSVSMEVDGNHWPVAPGDVDGDGYADFAVAGPTDLAFIPGGDVSVGRKLGLQQRIDGEARGPGYVAAAATDVGLGMELTDEVASLMPLALEVEVVRVDEPFTGQPSARGSLQGPGPATVTVSLAPGSYRWRARTWSAGFVSRWRSFGSNDEWTADFTLVAPSPATGGGEGSGGNSGIGGAGGVDGAGGGGGVGGSGGAGGEGEVGPLAFAPQACSCQSGAALPLGLLLGLAGLWRPGRRRRR